MLSHSYDQIATSILFPVYITASYMVANYKAIRLSQVISSLICSLAILYLYLNAHVFVSHRQKNGIFYLQYADKELCLYTHFNMVPS